MLSRLRPNPIFIVITKRSKLKNKKQQNKIKNEKKRLTLLQRFFAILISLIMLLIGIIMLGITILLSLKNVDKINIDFWFCGGFLLILIGGFSAFRATISTYAWGEDD